MKKKSLNIKIDAGAHERLKAISHETGIPMTNIILQSLTLWLESRGYETENKTQQLRNHKEK